MMHNAYLNDLLPIHLPRILHRDADGEVLLRVNRRWGDLEVRAVYENTRHTMSENRNIG